MPRGKTSSNLSLSERRQRASELIAKGFTNQDIAKKLGVTPETASSYRKWHRERVAETVQSNPTFMQDVLDNTVKALEENDLIRKEAWKRYHGTKAPQIKLQALNTVRQCQQDRAKIYGLFGVKQEVLAMFANVKAVQDRLLEFMVQELCGDDQKKLERLLTSPEFEKYMQSPALPSATQIIEVETHE